MVSVTFALIKPEAVAVPQIVKEQDKLMSQKAKGLVIYYYVPCWNSFFVVGVILKSINEIGLEIVGAKRLRMNLSDAEKLYGSHKNKFFYQRLICHVTSGPVMVMELRCKNGCAIDRWRSLMGPSKMAENLLPHNRSSLRSAYAISDTRNLVHGADSEQNVVNEMNIFLPPFPSLSVAGLFDQQ